MNISSVTVTGGYAGRSVTIEHDHHIDIILKFNDLTKLSVDEEQADIMSPDDVWELASRVQLFVDGYKGTKTDIREFRDLIENVR